MFHSAFSQSDSCTTKTNSWAFGKNAIMDFTTVPPTITDNSIMDAYFEGSASISDENGNLLFYSQGQNVFRVFNGVHSIMPNGNGLLGGESATQSAIFVQNPALPSIYYLFTVDDKWSGRGIKVSTINRGLDGGRGDVFEFAVNAFETNKNHHILSTKSEKIAAISKVNRQDSTWVIMNYFEQDKYHAYLVTAAGINFTPIVSNSLYNLSNSQGQVGQMKLSPQGNKIATAFLYDGSSSSRVEIADFNFATGSISNNQLLTLSDETYGVEFSPNGQYLYYSTLRVSGVRIGQLNISTGNVIPIHNDNDATYEYASLQLGPDQKIYCANDVVLDWESDFFSVIHNPDEDGLACNFELNAMEMTGNSKVRRGLPSIVTYVGNSCVDLELPDTSSCNIEILGLPVWPLTNSLSGNPAVIDWKTGEVSVLDNITTVLYQNVGTSIPAAGTATVGFDNCGEIAFYIFHSGMNTANNLFIYDRYGNPLLTDLINPPGLNSLTADRETQIIKVPGEDYEWFIVYKRWSSSVYDATNIVYSRIYYDGLNFSILDRDITLNDNVGIAHNYADGKAISNSGPQENTHYLYALRREQNQSLFSIDRFLISNTGISFDSNTGNISQSAYNLTHAGSFMELSPQEDKLAVVARNQASSTDDIYIFELPAFNNQSGNVQAINGNDLMLQPDGIFLSTPMSITSASSISGISYIRNFNRKVAGVQFSPSGRYLYTGVGGYNQSGVTNVTYLAQIDLDGNYPFDVRLQIQEVPYGFNPSTGIGCSTSDQNCLNSLNSITGSMQLAPDGNIYFAKRNSDKLWVIPNPDNPMAINLTPRDVDLSIPGIPNIDLPINISFVPEQIDHHNYYEGCDILIPIIVKRETCIDSCVTYDLELFEGDSLVHIFTAFACPDNNYVDTLYYCAKDDVDYNLNDIPNTTSYENAITDGLANYPNGTHFDFSTDSIFNLNLGNDTTLCLSDTLLLTPSISADDYLWQDGNTSENYQVTEPGVYWLEINIGGCTTRDSIAVDFQNPTLNIGNDTTICDGMSITLDASTENAVYTWNNGANTPTITVSDAGIYWAEVSLGSCSVIDSLEVSFENPISFSLGNDTIICGDINMNLSVTINADSYEWQDGNSGTSISVTQSGIYWVDLTIGGCTKRDSIVVSSADLSVNLGNDTSICTGDLLTLNASTNGATYLWQDGSSQETFNVTSSGTYWVEVSVGNCVARDSIAINVVSVNNIDLGNDTTLCFGQTLTLSADISGSNIIWQDGSTGNTFEVTEPGIYWVTTSQNNCAASDSIVVNFTDLDLDLGEDTIVICDGESILLTAGETGNNYDWQDGSNNSDFEITEGGIYWVSVSNNCGTIVDTIVVLESLCGCFYAFPNAFTPNGDGTNDYFEIININLTEIEIRIYNRWGEQVFESKDLDFQWGGIWKNTHQEMDVYTYYFEGKCPEIEETIKSKGTIALIR